MTREGRRRSRIAMLASPVAIVAVVAVAAAAPTWQAAGPAQGPVANAPALTASVEAAAPAAMPAQAAPGARTTAREQSVGAAASVAPRASTQVIGRSVRGRRIVARGYGDPAAQRVIAVVGVMHGSEKAGLGVVGRLAAAGAPAGTRMWLLPTINPDGRRAGTRLNARGVDINRNTPHKWRAGPRGVYYPGPRAASEPETRAYMGFLKRIRPDLVLIFHQDLNGVDSYGSKDPALLASLSRELSLSIKSFNCSGVCRGTLTGWFNRRFPGSAVTIELPARVGAKRVRKLAAGVARVASAI